MKFEDAYMLFGKYIGNWGGESIRFRFEGISDGKVVKTVTRASMTKLMLKADVSSSILNEGPTYDVASVRLRITDEYGNVMPFYNRTLRTEITGDIELIGPSAVDINGGMGGFYVKSMGKAGEAKVRVYDPDTGLEAEFSFGIRI